MKTTSLEHRPTTRWLHALTLLATCALVAACSGADPAETQQPELEEATTMPRPELNEVGLQQRRRDSTGIRCGEVCITYEGEAETCYPCTLMTDGECQC